MRIKDIYIKSFRRFSDLTIEGLPDTARLVVLTGPNGNGKSSLFDAFKIWHMQYDGGVNLDPFYHYKYGLPRVNHNQLVSIQFHEPIPSDGNERRKLFYIRSAYRNQADFEIHNIQKMGQLFDFPKINKLIDNDISVENNYKLLVSTAIQNVFSGEYDNSTVPELRDRLIGKVRSSMQKVFKDLLLKGVGDPFDSGSFFFDKGNSKDFHYKNLSGGEKSAFDILLDFIVKSVTYNNTVFCIDEPELHIHTRLQAGLLEELLSLVPNNSQLWIATHSIGMLRKARDLQSQTPNEVVFIDFHDVNFDVPVSLTPKKVDRQFWANMLDVALDDLSELIAPRQIVLCEGRPPTSSNDAKAAFDSRCYRQIFGNEFPETEFMSVRNASDVENDSLGIGKSIQSLIKGVDVLRVVDRDDKNLQEILDAQKLGVRVLTKRHIESYLLDDEILTKFCVANGYMEKIPEVLNAKSEAIANSVARGNPTDDLKSTAGETYNGIRKILMHNQLGNTAHAFMRDILAPLVTPETHVYKQLRQDIFGQ